MPVMKATDVAREIAARKRTSDVHRMCVVAGVLSCPCQTRGDKVCVEAAPEEAHLYGTPDVLNICQGSQLDNPECRIRSSALVDPSGQKIVH